MSLIPESTAEMAMNSTSHARARSRASVVLPEPGGPHRIIECGLREANANRERLAGPEKVFLPYEVLQRARTQPVGKRRVRLTLSE
jgi:hypothetical protein